MKLKDFLKQFEGSDPETEAYKRKGFEDDPPYKDFSKSFEILPLKDIKRVNAIDSILV